MCMRKMYLLLPYFDHRTHVDREPCGLNEYEKVNVKVKETGKYISLAIRS